MDTTLIGVVVGAILILFLVRGFGFFAARYNARKIYRQGMNAEITRSTSRRPVRYTGNPSLIHGATGFIVEPRRPEAALVGGENRFESGPAMEAPPVYCKDGAPPDYGEVARPPVAVVR